MARFRTIRYIIGAAFGSMWRNLLTTFTAIITIAIMLIVFSTFLAVNDTLDHMIDALGRRTNLVAYVQDAAPPSEITALVQSVSARADVAEIVFVSREQAADDFRNTLSDLAEILDVIETNPFPASIEVRMADPEGLLPLADELRLQPALIDQVLVRADVVGRLLRVSNLARIGGGILIISLGAVTLFVIFNTIRLAVYSRREEIEIMRLIGATDWFVRGPFVVEGAVIGFIGAGLSAIAVVAGYARVGPTLESLVSFLPIQTQTGFVTNLALFTMLMGVLIGSVGSYFSVRRYLEN
ncbi:MAG: permease-like cell division protein FtsX [Chloroflexota bacterium]|nr:permease-like cell division protein FtsX [Chloroflexota bacterium]MDP6509443.1 permease-like cell division protein FtsX [Chloroflexota bacterium]MDP6758479.1 permease-like cell division protein FtsX [Chloroflexota bacterium]